MVSFTTGTWIQEQQHTKAIMFTIVAFPATSSKNAICTASSLLRFPVLTCSVTSLLTRSSLGDSRRFSTSWVRYLRSSLKSHVSLPVGLVRDWILRTVRHQMLLWPLSYRLCGWHFVGSKTRGLQKGLRGWCRSSEPVSG